MQGQQKVSRLSSFIKSILTITALTVFVLLVSLPVINFNMMYPEQPIMYLINQQIHSFWDLLNVYLHPQMMTFTIPFFRPSGHFLIYQILYPFIDPHNFKALTIINLIFLALSGFLMVKIYPLLFPNFKMGGYIAFAIYLMHPALILSRMISLHFEFAYIFFMLWSLYCFIRYCQLKFSPNYLFLSSLFFYILACTFKEPAILLGPSLAIYYLIYHYQGGGLLRFSRTMVFQRQSRNILLLLGVVSLTLLIYFTLPWPTMTNPLRSSNVPKEILPSTTKLIHYLFNIDFAKKTSIDEVRFFRSIVFPLSVTAVLWISIITSVAMSVLIRKDKEPTFATYKKSLVFLLASALLYLVLPITWGVAYPWHLSSTILMLGFVVGFSFDYLGSLFLRFSLQQEVFCGLIAVIIASLAFWANTAAVNSYSENKMFSLEFKVLSNAVLMPPDIKAKLTSNSIIVIQDAILRDDYITSGGQVYSLIAYDSSQYDILKSYDTVQRVFGNVYFKMHPTYSGTLFRFAYLMPELREMSFPFSVDEMQDVNEFAIYLWLLDLENIFCLGYDNDGQWHNLTEKFKKNLIAEKTSRGIEVNHYKDIPFAMLSGQAIQHISIPYPNVTMCQYTCDQNNLCKGFTYKNYEAYGKRVTKCDFYNEITDETEPCIACASYVKT